MSSTIITHLFHIPSTFHFYHKKNPTFTTKCTSKPSQENSQEMLQEKLHENSQEMFQEKLHENSQEMFQEKLHENSQEIFQEKLHAKSQEPEFPSPSPSSQTTTSAEKFPIERRRRSEIIRDRKSRGLVKPKPKNFEIGWKRTKEIPLEKQKGYVIMDFLEKLIGLMDMEFGSAELLAKTAEIVAERAREEAEVLLDEGKVEDRMVTELFRVLKLMEMDLAMVKAAVKEETLSERLEKAKARCRQAILVANSF